MIKIYNGLSEAENYEVNLNKICNSFEFKSFISKRHKLCPRGLTISCWFSEETQSLKFCPEIKYYGYDHIHNNGTAYTDMGDYESGPAVNEEIAQSMFEYFKTNEPEIYEVMVQSV